MHLLAGKLMDRKISIKIGEREFKLSASSPQQEEVIRLAAKTINNRLQDYTVRHAGKNILDIMSMVALNETVQRIVVQKELKLRDSDIDKLGEDLDRYLAGTE